MKYVCCKALVVAPRGVKRNFLPFSVRPAVSEYKILGKEVNRVAAFIFIV